LIDYLCLFSIVDIVLLLLLFQTIWSTWMLTHLIAKILKVSSLV